MFSSIVDLLNSDRGKNILLFLFLISIIIALIGFGLNWLIGDS